MTTSSRVGHAIRRSTVLVFLLGLCQQIIAAPGRVGCFYDLQLCEENELCFNDSLFGTCVAELSDAINYNDLEPEALGEAAQVLQYLIETGYKWQDSYTQCVVGKFLQSAVTHQRYDPEVCEYLKALLDVIDQNKARQDEAPAVAPSDLSPPQIGSEVAPLQISNGQAPHGEFITQADMSTDFDQQQPQSLPVEPMNPIQQQTNQPDPNTFDLQQYLQAYQRALDEAAQKPQNSDLITAQKKSDSAVPVIGSETATTTVAPTTTTISTVTPVSSVPVDDSLLTQLNNTADEDDNQEAMRALVSLVNSYPTSEERNDNMPVLFATASDPVDPQDQQMTIGVPFSGPEMQEMMQPRNSWPDYPDQQQNFPPVQDVYVPDFNAIPPPEILQDMFIRSARAQLQAQPRISAADLIMAQQLFGPPQKDLPMMDPRLMDPRLHMQMDPRMMSQPDPRMVMDISQIDPRVIQQLDPRMLMDQTGGQFDPRMMQLDPRLMQMNQPPIDPRMLFGNGFGMNPNLMSSPPFMMSNQPQMDPMMGMPMKRGGDFFQQDPPPNFGGMPFMQAGGPDMSYMDPRIQSLYGPNPYGFFPQGVALPFTQPEWRPPMALPDGFVFAEQGFPVLEAPVNESADLNDQQPSVGAMLGENIDELSANGASGPTSPNKKDQEYRSLLPSDESQDQVVEDVTVTVVKGNADKPIPSGDLSGTVGGDTDDDTTTVRDDNYVYLQTKPQLDRGQAQYFLKWLSAVMTMPPETFYDVNVIDDLLTFRVNPAVQKLNATYVAQTLGDAALRNDLKRLNDFQIEASGVGRYLIDDSDSEVTVFRFQKTAVVATVAPQTAASAQEAVANKFALLDPNTAFIVTEPALSDDKARDLLQWLAQKLGVPVQIFSNLRAGDQTKFYVEPYGDVNATGVVDKLTDTKIRAELQQQFGIEIIQSGIGDSHVQVIRADFRQRRTLIIGLIAVASVAAILVMLGIIYLVRRNVVMRKKLHGLGGDVESSKEYEELCRQRMACKNIEATIGASPDYKTHDRTNHSSTSSWSEEPAPTNMDITTGHMVLSYMEDHLKHKERMSEEWASLCTYEADPSKTEAGSKLENLLKNRYPDVLPYDHTRVHLNPEENYTKSDYVNANLITDADPKNAVYIATQGPLPDTVADFWQMVWENNSTVIVMLTKLRENDQDLCHVYWPKEGSECYNIFEVHLVSEHIWCDDYLVRNFYLKNLQTHETRTVTQFHYLNWPSLGVPSSLKTFLEFRRKINKCYKGGSSPIVVHCSDGVDRTGAYCVIDLVLNRMAKGVKEIDIAATLEHLRDQRMDMVRTKDQFEFVLTAVAQEIQAILKSMPQK